MHQLEVELFRQRMGKLGLEIRIFHIEPVDGVFQIDQFVPIGGCSGGPHGNPAVGQQELFLGHGIGGGVHHEVNASGL